MRNVKIIANYLPQYHETELNNMFWGKGYTDWAGVKKAKPTYHGHMQPKVPLNDHYYDLSHPEEIAKQIEMANNYGIYGFAIYHYWFNSQLQALQKPAEIILKYKEFDTHYLFIWDNSSWIRTWSAIQNGNSWSANVDEGVTDRNNGVLAELDYGNEEDWKIHYEYLKPFFQDERYIKIDGMPVFGIFNPRTEPETLRKMISCWDKLARESGFEGIRVLVNCNKGNHGVSEDGFFYEPTNSGWETRTLIQKSVNYLYKRFGEKINRPRKYDYDTIWRKLLSKARNCKNERIYFGAFAQYDDTPRRGRHARIVMNASSQKFKSYLSELVEISEEQSKEFIFITAWNEWGEGAYLEPDTVNNYSYLEAIRDVICE